VLQHTVLYNFKPPDKLGDLQFKNERLRSVVILPPSFQSAFPRGRRRRVKSQDCGGCDLTIDCDPPSFLFFPFFGVGNYHNCDIPCKPFRIIFREKFGLVLIRADTVAQVYVHIYKDVFLGGKIVQRTDATQRGDGRVCSLEQFQSVKCQS
jgi:hypothetical protein